MTEYNRTVWEKLGAAEGLWAAILLSLQCWILMGTKADPGSADGFVAALAGERMAWEWMTFLRIVAGLMVIWWMGSLAGRLRLAEGEPGRLATIAFGVGVTWGGLWLLSAFLNSATLLLAFDYADPAGARMAGALAMEVMYVLTPAIAVVLTFATMLVAHRFGGFPKWYAWATTAACGLLFALAIVDWYGPGGLSMPILWVALGWMALTSALLIPTYRPPSATTGEQERVAA